MRSCQTRPWRKITQRASPEPKGFQLRLFSFAEMATLSPAMSWHTGRKATPSTPDDAFVLKPRTHQSGLFFWIGVVFWIGVEGLGQSQPTVRLL